MEASETNQEQALAPFAVSRETKARLQKLVHELHRWQAIKNLVSRQTLGQVWTRHVADSLQLAALAPEARVWLDLGSGAGFPGLVLAIALADAPGAAVHLVEGNARKSAFLRHVARLTNVPAIIHEGRIEEVVPALVGANEIQIVTARALAPLGQLLAWAEPLLTTSAIGLFPKGREAKAELTEAAKSWKFGAELIPSLTDSEARIIRINSLQRL
jgi:16S rRNA (guanine527-N7)-methyltransferase